MNSLFMPKNQELLDLKRLKPSRPLSDHVVVIGMENHIYALPRFAREPIEIAERPGSVYTLCEHDGVLYDGGDYTGIRKTLTDSVLYEELGNVNCITEGVGLFVGSSRGFFKIPNGGKIIRYDPSIYKHTGSVESVALHKSDIYLSSKQEDDKGFITYTLRGDILSKDGAYAPYLYSDLFTLYETAGHIILDLTKEEIFTDRANTIFGLCNHDSVLYDFGAYGICDTHDDESVFKNFYPVYSMASVHKKCLGGLL